MNISLFIYIIFFLFAKNYKCMNRARMNRVENYFEVEIFYLTFCYLYIYVCARLPVFSVSYYVMGNFCSSI